MGGLKRIVRLLLFWFSVTSKMQKKVHLTKTSCINLSINVCLWEFPVSTFFPSMACFSVFRQSTCVCVFPVCVSVTPSSTCCVGIHGAGEAGVCGGAAYASTITCSYRSSPPPSLPSKKKDPGALSICLKKQVWNLSKNKTTVRPVV